jgi:hypothetical protein
MVGDNFYLDNGDCSLNGDGSIMYCAAPDSLTNVTCTVMGVNSESVTITGAIIINSTVIGGTIGSGGTCTESPLPDAVQL